ncbi:MAG: hypothetical protein PWQ63_571 [Methanolobus sp.]|jgi:hypothetical protein|nr:hypothetical protein [Methanolobus sp.]
MKEPLFVLISVMNMKYGFMYTKNLILSSEKH